MRPTKIVAGGQWGADVGGLLGAKAVGIETGGVAPKGWKTERGPNPWLASLGLVESHSTNYKVRTLANVQNADGTALFGDMTSPGSKLTLDLLWDRQIPYIVNPSVQELREFIINERIKVLNIAGNRESVSPGLQDKVRTLIIEAFPPS
jgi:hypothetical protein